MSALAYHSWTVGHNICFEETKILHKSLSRGTRILREFLELQLSQTIINKEEGAKLSAAWLPACEQMKAAGSAVTWNLSSQAQERLL